jgi:phosphoribosylanthranilate isomerase
MKTPKVKFCGLTREQDIILAQELEVDFVGFIFTNSKRQISAPRAKKLSSQLHSQIKRIGVFSDQDLDTLIETADFAGLDGVQLHGQETSDYSQKIKLRRPKLLIIKAIEIAAPLNMSIYENFECDYFLFDSPRKDSLRKPYEIENLLSLKPPRPFFIAGGLNPNNVRARVEALNPYGVDVCSGIEISPGIKSARDMSLFIDALSRRIA